MHCPGPKVNRLSASRRPGRLTVLVVLTAFLHFALGVHLDSWDIPLSGNEHGQQVAHDRTGQPIHNGHILTPDRRSLRHLQQEHQRAGGIRIGALDTAGSVIDSETGLTTEQRIARLHESFQQNAHSGEGADETRQVPPLDIPPDWPPDAEHAVPLPNLDDMIRRAGIDTASPFLFIGILSSRRTYRRRVTVRNTWLQFVTHMPTRLVEARFVLSPDEVSDDDSVADESVLYAHAAVTYSTILIKVYVMFEHSLQIGARWLLKTDDDAYVNIPQCVQNLLKMCESAACDRQRTYVGTFISGAPVMMDATHKWHNEAYIMHASVKNYPPYALGGGYILSLDVLQVLVALHRSVSLTFTAIEDANVGMWLMGMNITRINWEGIMSTAGWTCCFSRTKDKNVRSEVLGRYTMSNDPCRPQRVYRKLHMHESIQQLLERSEKVQTDEVGQALDLSDVDDSGSLQEKGSFFNSAHATVLRGVNDWSTALGAGWRRLTRFAAGPGSGSARRAGRRQLWTDGDDAEGAGLDAAHDEGLAGQDEEEEEEKAMEDLANWRNVTLMQQEIAAFDMRGEGQSWRTRPMVLHKVANPLHMHYLHWRLQHCSVPKRDLIGGPGEVLATHDLPSLHDIFHVSNRAGHVHAE